MEKQEYILGIDIGGTSIKIGVVSKGNVIESYSVRNIYKGHFNNLLLGIYPLCDKYVKKYFINKIGVGCPGDFKDNVLIKAVNLGWQNINVLQKFKETFPNKEIIVANDGYAAYMAERKYGDLKEEVNGVMLTIGKGIGGTLLINNQVVKGSHNMGGRIGHMVIRSGGRKCNCGKKGCFEAYGSITGLLKTVNEYNLKEYPEQEKIDVERLSGYKIAQYLKEEKKVVVDAVNKWHKDIVEGILNICNFMDPNMIIIAGGITESEILNIDYLIEKIHSKGYKNVTIKSSSLKGNTGLIGAASLFI